MEQIVVDRFGSLDEMRDLKWIVYLWADEDVGGRAFGSFKMFLEYLVLRSEESW